MTAAQAMRLRSGEELDGRIVRGNLGGAALARCHEMVYRIVEEIKSNK